MLTFSSIGRSLAASAALLLCGFGVRDGGTTYRGRYSPRITVCKPASRYTPDVLGTVRDMRAQRNVKRALQRLRADFFNPCVTDVQMLERHRSAGPL